MNIHEVIKQRRAVRSYKSDPVPEESLKRILEAARLVPLAKIRKSLAEISCEENFSE
jgi:nitroreductase